MYESHASGPFNGNVSHVLLFLMIGVLLLVLLLFLALMVVGTVCSWKIFKKAGYSGSLGLLFLLSLVLWPLGEVVVLLMLAFGKWPVIEELNRLNASQNQPRQ